LDYCNIGMWKYSSGICS